MYWGDVNQMEQREPQPDLNAGMYKLETSMAARDDKLMAN